MGFPSEWPGLVGMRFRGSGWSRVASADELAVGGLVVDGGELEQAVEELAAVAGGAAVEAEHELVEVGVEVSLLDAALVGAEQPALQQ